MRHQTGFLHHVGSFLLLAATVLLVVTSISAPTVKHLSVLRVEIDGGLTDGGNPAVTFGTFGWCLQNVGSSGDEDECHGPVVGYSPVGVLRDLAGADDDDVSEHATATARALTHVMILHPVAAGLAFISFLLALGAGTIGSLLAALVALLTFLVAAVALVCDFVGFAVVARQARDHLSSVSSDGDTDVRTMYGSGAWTLLAAAVCLLLGTLVVFFTCCSARLHRRRQPRGMAGVPPAVGPGDKSDYGAPRRRRRFGIF